MDVTTTFLVVTAAITILLAAIGRTMYVNLGRHGGYRVGIGKLERTKMGNTRGLPLINIGRLKSRRRHR